MDGSGRKASGWTYSPYQYPVLLWCDTDTLGEERLCILQGDQNLASITGFVPGRAGPGGGGGGLAPWFLLPVAVAVAQDFVGGASDATTTARRP